MPNTKPEILIQYLRTEAISWLNELVCPCPYGTLSSEEAARRSRVIRIIAVGVVGELSDIQLLRMGSQDNESRPDSDDLWGMEVLRKVLISLVESALANHLNGSK